MLEGLEVNKPKIQNMCVNARIGMKTSNGRGMRGGEEDGEREGVDFGWNAGRSV